MCTVDGCDRELLARGLCRSHYEKDRRTGALPKLALPSAAERLAALLVRTTNGCLEWTGRRKPKGYGQIYVQGKQVGTHRLAWTLAYGPIPDGLCVLHRCDNPPCCDPEHLFLGTKADNNADMQMKGRDKYGDSQRARTHCPQGHPYDEANTFTTRDGKRRCRACMRLQGLRSEAKNRPPKRLPPRSHCKNGHAFDGDNTYLYRGKRVCRACVRAAQARSRSSRA